MLRTRKPVPGFRRPIPDGELEPSNFTAEVDLWAIRLSAMGRPLGELSPCAAARLRELIVRASRHTHWIHPRPVEVLRFHIRSQRLVRSWLTVTAKNSLVIVTDENGCEFCVLYRNRALDLAKRLEVTIAAFSERFARGRRSTRVA